jgi:hypothetical protein
MKEEKTIEQVKTKADKTRVGVKPLVRWIFILFSPLKSVILSWFVSRFLNDLEPWERWEFCKSLLWVVVVYAVLGFLIGYFL